MSKTKWRALDHCDDTGQNDETVLQEGQQSITTQQDSFEWIIIKDSEDINVTTTDTQAAVSLELGIQVAIGVVLSIAIGSSTQADQVVQDLKQVTRNRQSNRQKTIVEQSKDVDIVTRDTDIAINLQLLIQILVAIVISLDIL
ncbi:spore coat protein [Virgibacillus sp. YIM 98842]|uniref:spore coat protein n=1 Tax=Virgibacillus sp. YIM 98842 TaxID=2663533 RepID=UPI0013DB28D9|nr:spore coat protein [Virgibacillus sp. YIM 98842]